MIRFKFLLTPFACELCQRPYRRQPGSYIWSRQLYVFGVLFAYWTVKP